MVLEVLACLVTMVASLVLLALVGSALAAPLNLAGRALPTPVSAATARTYANERRCMAFGI